MAVLLAGGTALAQTKTGTTFGTFTLIEPSARITGMGNAGATLHDEVLAGYYNPAALAHLTRFGVQFTHSAWFADIAYDHVAVAFPMATRGVFGASVTALNSGDIEVRTVTQPLGTGERYHVSDVALGLAWARQLTDRFSMGFRASYLQETIWHSSADALTLGLGTLYQVSDNGLYLGSSLSNYGTQARFTGEDLRIAYDATPAIHGDNSGLPADNLTDPFNVPTLFRVGLGMPFRTGPTGRLIVAVEGLHPSDATESVNAGMEWTYRETISLRAGFQGAFEQDAEGGLRLGAGLRHRVQGAFLSADYAWADQGRLGDTHRFTLGVSY